MRAERSRGSLRLAQLEEIMYALHMATGPRSRGRKPLGFIRLQTIDDVCRVLLDTDLYQASASAKRR